MATNLDLPLPDRAISLSNLGRALTKLGRLDEAEAAYNEGIAVEDRLLRGVAREEKAAWLVEQGSLRGSGRHLRVAVGTVLDRCRPARALPAQPGHPAQLGLGAQARSHTRAALFVALAYRLTSSGFRQY